MADDKAKQQPAGLDDILMRITIRKRLAFAAALAVLLLIVLEGMGQTYLFLKRNVFRPASWDEPNPDLDCEPNAGNCPIQPFQADQGRALRADPYTGYNWTPGFQGEWLTINSLGFRGPEISRDKPAGILRIAMVGPSTVVGAGVHDDETVEAYLQAELTHRLDQPVEVVNAGVTGFHSSQDLAELIFRVLDLNPDVVVVYDGRNDLYYGLSPTWSPHYRPGLAESLLFLSGGGEGASSQQAGSRRFIDTPFGTFLTTKVALGRMAHKVIGTAKDLIAPDTTGFDATNEPPNADQLLEFHPEALEVYRHNLVLMAQAVREQDAIPVFVLQPSLETGQKPQSATEMERLDLSERQLALMAEHYPALGEALLSAGEETGTPAYDFSAIFADNEDTLYLDAGHLNADGNRLVAARLADILVDVIETGE